MNDNGVSKSRLKGFPRDVVNCDALLTAQFKKATGRDNNTGEIITCRGRAYIGIAMFEDVQKNAVTVNQGLVNLGIWEHEFHPRAIHYMGRDYDAVSVDEKQLRMAVQQNSKIAKLSKDRLEQLLELLGVEDFTELSVSFQAEETLIEFVYDGMGMAYIQTADMEENQLGEVLARLNELKHVDAMTAAKVIEPIFRQHYPQVELPLEIRAHDNKMVIVVDSVQWLKAMKIDPDRDYGGPAQQR